MQREIIQRSHDLVETDELSEQLKTLIWIEHNQIVMDYSGVLKVLFHCVKNEMKKAANQPASATIIDVLSITKNLRRAAISREYENKFLEYRANTVDPQIREWRQLIAELPPEDVEVARNSITSTAVVLRNDLKCMVESYRSELSATY